MSDTLILKSGKDKVDLDGFNFALLDLIKRIEELEYQLGLREVPKNK